MLSHNYCPQNGSAVLTEKHSEYTELRELSEAKSYWRQPCATRPRRRICLPKKTRNRRGKLRRDIGGSGAAATGVLSTIVFFGGRRRNFPWKLPRFPWKLPRFPWKLPQLPRKLPCTRGSLHGSAGSFHGSAGNFYGSRGNSHLPSTWKLPWKLPVEVSVEI